MARPMRTPVKWDRGSVSVAPIAQPFKGILEGFGIDESDYSAEGGFGESGLLDWEPAEFISPDVVWGTQYVSGAPPPSHYMNGDDDDNGEDNGEDKCTYGKRADGTCKPKPDDGCDAGYHKEGGVCVKDVDDGCDPGYHKSGGVCVKDDDDPPDPTCADSGECGPWPTCYPCDPGQDDTLDESDGGYRPPGWVDDTWTDEEVAAGEFDTGPSGPSGPSWADVVAEEAAANAVAAAAAADQERENAFLDTFDYTYVNPFAGYDPVEDYGVQGEFYDPWAFEDIRGGRR